VVQGSEAYPRSPRLYAQDASGQQLEPVRRHRHSIAQAQPAAPQNMWPILPQVEEESIQ
jgi:hypothetical protein